MSYLFATLVFLIGACEIDADNWRSQIFYFGLIAIGFETIRLTKFHFLVAITFFYAAASALYCFSYPYTPYLKYIKIIPIFDANAAMSLCYLWAASSFLLAVQTNTKEWVKAIGWLVLFNSLLIFYHGFMADKKYAPVAQFVGNWWGLLGNPAMDASLIGSSYVIFLRNIRKLSLPYFLPLAGVPVLAVLLTKSSTGLGCLCLSILIFSFTVSKGRRLLMFGLSVLLFGAGALTIKGDLFHDSGRFQEWSFYFTFWKNNLNIWFGAGSGAFISFADIFRRDLLMIWLHNDWLQILFEQGIVGLLLVLGVWYKLCTASFPRPWLFASVISYGCMAFLQMPIRHPIATIVGLVLLAACFEKKPSPKLSVCQS